MGDSSGDENRGDGETPRHEVSISAFEIDTTSVTNDDFARFVDDTGYLTEAETFGFSAARPQSQLRVVDQGQESLIIRNH